MKRVMKQTVKHKDEHNETKVNDGKQIYLSEKRLQNKKFYNRKNTCET